MLNTKLKKYYTIPLSHHRYRYHIILIFIPFTFWFNTKPLDVFSAEQQLGGIGDGKHFTNLAPHFKIDDKFIITNIPFRW